MPVHVSSEIGRLRSVLVHTPGPEVLANREVRDLLVKETMDIVPSEPLAREIADLPAEALVQMLIEGREEEAGPLATALNEHGYVLPALPNLFFTRDVAMVLEDHVLIGAMRHGIR